jgi:hypothetical protein
MLIGNYDMLMKSPGRFGAGSGTSVESKLRSNFSKPNDLRNVQYRDEGTVLNLWSVPSYYYPNYTWMLPTTRGQMGAANFIAGTGSLASAIDGGKNATATLSGEGTLEDVTGQLIVALAAALSGSGTISQADLIGYLQLAAAISGSGTVVGLLRADGYLAAILAGTGGATLVPYATGTLAAEVNVTGGTLTTANVGDAVWGALLEAGFDASQILRIIAAATAGEHTQSGTDVTFRNLSDTQDQITGTADASGNRSAITYGD